MILILILILPNLHIHPTASRYLPSPQQAAQIPSVNTNHEQVLEVPQSGPSSHVALS